MFETHWVRQPMGALKILALFLATLSLGFAIAAKDGFFVFSHDPHFVFYLAVFILPTNVLVLLCMLLGYILDDNIGFCYLTEVTFDVVHGILSIILGGLWLYFTLKVTDPSLESYLFVVLIMAFALVLFIDAVVFTHLAFEYELDLEELLFY